MERYVLISPRRKKENSHVVAEPDMVVLDRRLTGSGKRWLRAIGNRWNRDPYRLIREGQLAWRPKPDAAWRCGKFIGRLYQRTHAPFHGL